MSKLQPEDQLDVRGSRTLARPPAGESEHCAVNFFHIVYVLSHWVMSNSLHPHGLWGFPRQEYWGGFLCPSPGDLLNPSDRIQVSKHCRWILYHLSYHIEGSTMTDMFDSIHSFNTCEIIVSKIYKYMAPSEF